MQRHGARFTPCALLKKMLEQQQTFYKPDVNLNSFRDSAG